MTMESSRSPEAMLLVLLGVELDYLLYLEVSPDWTPICNVVTTSPLIYALQRGSEGAAVLLKLKIDVKFPCKML